MSTEQELQPINNNNNNNAPDQDDAPTAVVTVVEPVDTTNPDSPTIKASTQHEEQNDARNGFFRTEDWSFRAGVLGCICAILAAAVPQWVYVVPDALTFGLRATCKGDRCLAMDFSLMKNTLNCNGGCDDAFDQFRLRWRAIEAFGYMGAIFFLLMAAAVRIGYTRDVRSTALGAPHVMISICGIFAVGTSVIIFGGSLSCGAGCFEYGASVICQLIAVGFAVICIPMGLVAAKCEHLRQTVGRFTFATAILGAAFEFAAMLSNRWFYRKKTVNSDLNAVSIGLFQRCSDTACKLANYTEYLETGNDAKCSNKDSSALETRFLVGAIFLILGAVACLVMAILAYKKIGGHLARGIALFVSLTFVTVGNALVLATLDGWMFCDRTYCEVVSRLGTNTSCTPGASFAFALCCNLMLGIVVIMEVFNFFYRLCGVEETEGESLLAAQQQIAAEKRERARIKQEQAEEEERERVREEKRKEKEAEEAERKRKEKEEEEEAAARKEAAAEALRQAVAEREAQAAAEEAAARAEQDAQMAAVAAAVVAAAAPIDVSAADQEAVVQEAVAEHDAAIEEADEKVAAEQEAEAEAEAEQQEQEQQQQQQEEEQPNENENEDEAADENKDEEAAAEEGGEADADAEQGDEANADADADADAEENPVRGEE